MNQVPHSWKSFILKLVLPTLITISLFIFSIFYIYIPELETDMMQLKRDMTKELTQTALSVLEEYAEKERNGELTREQAQTEAIARINKMRYGDESKDYFWITDMQTKMVVHPYRPDLNGKDVSNEVDRHGKKIFLEFTNLIKEEKEGYFNYMWQWKDKQSVVVPKLSYVKGFPQWEWIIGTGIYVEDVKREIHSLTSKLITTSVIIIASILMILLYILWQTLVLEKKRHKAVEGEKESKEKYKALVEAATDGFIMLLEQTELLCNPTIIDMLGYTDEEFKSTTIYDLINQQDNDGSGSEELKLLMDNKPAPSQFEAQLIKKDKTTLDVILTASLISFAGKKGFILIARDISEFRQLERKRQESEREQLIVELQSTLLFLNQTITDFATDIVSCNMDTSIEKVASIMTQKNAGAILVAAESGNHESSKYIGIVTDHDIRERAISKGVDLKSSVVEIMSAPLVTISDKAMVFETAQLMQEKNVRHVVLQKSNGKIDKIITNSELLQVQGYSAVSIIESINKADSLDEIQKRHSKLPMLVTAVLNSGGNSENVARIIAKVADATVIKLVEFALDELGPAPCEFSFMTMGSEGREEQTLNTDQDNALIYADPAPEDEEMVQEYFLNLSKKICTWLDMVGYDFCDGKIMAMNPQWCLSLSKWKEQYYTWINSATPQDLLEVYIFFDFRCVYGSSQLTGELRKEAFKYIDNNSLFMIFLARDALLYKPPLSLFGNIVTESSGEHTKTFNIKAAMRTIINFARIYALKHNIFECNTFERLRILNDNGHLDDSMYNEIFLAYSFLMQMRLKHQATSAKNGYQIDNYINPKKITQIERLMLKNIFAQMSTFQTKLGIDFRGAREDGI